MKALYFKELRQGRPLLLFGLVIGLLIAAAYAVLARTEWFRNPQPQDYLSLIFGTIILVPIPLIGLLAGAGLLSVEVERSTAPVLLSLPISRRGIWFAKFLAGLTLTAMSALLLLVVAVLLMPRAATSWSASMLLPDCYLITIALFALAFFCSALAAHTVAAIILTLLLGALFTTGSAYLFSRGAYLLGYDPAFDMELWVFCAIPALLFSGALAIARGELLQSWRKWAIGLLALVISVSVTVLVVVGIARWATRYQRSAVVLVYGGETGATRPLAAITLLTSGDPVEFRRQGEGGWMRVDWKRRREGNPEESPSAFDFRSEYAISLDARTGRELLVLRRPTGAAIHSAYSRDGRLAAFALPHSPLTWGESAGWREAGHTLAIYDLQRHGRLYSGLPDQLREQAVRFLTDLRWSPSGSFLAASGGPSETGRAPTAIYLIRPDGSVHRALSPLSCWAWSPSEDVILGLDSLGKLHRLSPEGEDRVIWQPEGTSAPAPARQVGPYAPRPLPRPGSVAISPDGKWLAFSTAYARTETPSIEGASFEVYRDPRVYVIHADGADHRAMLVPARHGPGPAEYSEIPTLLWSSDGSALYVLAVRQLEDGSFASQLFRWRPGDPGLSPVAPLLGKFVEEASYARPGSDEIVVTVSRQGAVRPAESEAGRFGPAPGGGAPPTWAREMVLLDGRDHVRRVPAADAERLHRVVGFDREGRLLILTGWRDLIALDPDIGKATRLYP
jgi:hypothetical protein